MISPEPLQLILTARQALLAELVETVMCGTPLLALTGPAGTGKTTIARALQHELQGRSARVLHVCRGEGQVIGLRAIAAQLLGRSEADFSADDIEALFDVLTTRTAPDQRLVLIIDEAELLAADALGYFRLLTSIAIDEMPQIVFIGQPSFWNGADHPTQADLRELITDRWELEPLTDEAAEACATIAPLEASAAAADPIEAADEAVPHTARGRGTLAVLQRLGVALVVMAVGVAAFWELALRDHRMAALAGSLFGARIQSASLPRPVHPAATNGTWQLADILDRALVADTAPAPDVLAEASPDRMEPAEEPSPVSAPAVLVEASPDRMEPFVPMPEEAAPAVLVEASPDRTEPPAPAPAEAVPAVLAEASPDRMAPYEPAPPEPPPITPPKPPLVSAQDLASLLMRGDAMLGLNDVVAARLFYERAANLGSARGATLLGRTYDPGVLASLQATGVTPDRQLAASWYRKGEAGGDSEGKRLLAKLAIGR